MDCLSTDAEIRSQTCNATARTRGNRTSNHLLGPSNQAGSLHIVVSSHPQCYRQDQGLPDLNPFAWSVSGRMYVSLAIQAAGVTRMLFRSKGHCLQAQSFKSKFNCSRNQLI